MGMDMLANAALQHSNGFRIGKTAKPNRPRVEIGYGNPKVKGHTIVNVNNSSGKAIFRIDFDPVNSFHFHYGATNKQMNLHRKETVWIMMGAIGGFTGIVRNVVKGPVR